jgi:hypothetical protein
MSEKYPGRPKDKDLIRLKDCSPIVKELTGVERSQEAIYYWATKGLINRHSVKVFLRTTKRIKTLYTTREWLKTFLENV